MNTPKIVDRFGEAQSSYIRLDNRIWDVTILTPFILFDLFPNKIAQLVGCRYIFSNLVFKQSDLVYKLKDSYQKDFVSRRSFC